MVFKSLSVFDGSRSNLLTHFYTDFTFQLFLENMLNIIVYYYYYNYDIFFPSGKIMPKMYLFLSFLRSPLVVVLYRHVW